MRGGDDEGSIKYLVSSIKLFAGTGLQPASKCFLYAQNKMILQNRRNGLQTRYRIKNRIVKLLNC